MNTGMDWTKVLQALFQGAGVGGPIALFVYIALRTAKSALVEAVKLAGQKEIEARKNELAKDLEDHKKGLTLEVERTRAAAQVDLERFKSELTLAAETRRQVASIKVKALLDFLQAAQQFLDVAFFHAPDNQEERRKVVAQLRDCYARVNQIQPLVQHDVYVKLSNLVTHIFDKARMWVRGDDDQALTNITNELKNVIDLVRSELGVSANHELRKER